MQPIYLDYAATTPVDPRVAAKMLECLTKDGVFANPASMHSYGQAARLRIEEARVQVANLIHAEIEEIIWTSGATEAINLAIKGAMRLYERKGKHLITMKTEHKAVLDVCQYLEKQGFSVTYLKPLENGTLDLQTLENAIRKDTVLVSIMHVNNETGAIQDIDAIANITQKHGILYHVDAAQSTGKLALDVTKTPIDLISMSAHKTYGPKGIGALYLRKKPRVRVEPLLHGGGHEQGMRSGTLPTHQIVGMGEAFFIASREMQQDKLHIENLRNRFIQGLTSILNLRMNTEVLFSVPHILNVRFDGMLADAILAQLPMIATSTASACQGKGTEGSYVLRALGLSEDQAKASIRFSFGRFTTMNEVDAATKMITDLFIR